jgi:hypothetical protein
LRLSRQDRFAAANSESFGTPPPRLIGSPLQHPSFISRLPNLFIRFLTFLTTHVWCLLFGTLTTQIIPKLSYPRDTNASEGNSRPAATYGIAEATNTSVFQTNAHARPEPIEMRHQDSKSCHDFHPVVSHATLGGESHCRPVHRGSSC